MILKASSIREVIAFPKNRSAYCPLTDAPSRVEPSRLAELGLESSTEAEPRSEGDAVPPAKRRAPGVEEERISLEAVRLVARLARLRGSPEELRGYQGELNAVLTHFETLQGLDTEKVHPMVQVTEARNVWREDAPAGTGEPERLLSLAPVRDKDYFKVPRILEG
jgi:aspartyl/glutamyl-tRNA(Asn/Gln) amidotransferase C subunit